MSVDIATLGIKVDASEADNASTKLDNLAQAGAKTEASTKRVTSATDTFKAMLSATIGAINANTSALASHTSNLNRSATATRSASNAADDMESRMARLRSSVDPLGVAIDRVNAELAENRTLFEAGAIGAADYERNITILNARSLDFHGRQSNLTEAMGAGGRAAKLQAHEMLNLSRQFADIGVTAAMGMNPLMILVQQGPQIADVLGTARARGVGMADAMRQIGVPIMRFLPLLLTVGITAGAAFATLGLAARGATLEFGKVTDGMHLSEKQMDRLKDKGTELGYTMGDVGAGIASAIADAFNLDDVANAWNKAMDYMGEKAFNFVEDIVGEFGGMAGAVKVFFSDIPRSVGAILIEVLNQTIDFMNDVMSRATTGINYLRSLANSAPVEAWSIKNVKNPLQSQLGNMSDGYDEGKNSAKAAFRKGMKSHARKRIEEDAGDPEKAKKPKAATKEKKSDEERDYDSALKGAKSYIEALEKETDAIGKNRFETKQLSTEREKSELIAKAGATHSAANMAKALEMTQKMTVAQNAWNEATNAEGIKKLKEKLDDEIIALKFSTSLLGMNNEERAKAEAIRNVSLQVLALERDGYWEVAAAIRGQAQELERLAGIEGAKKDNLDASAQTTASMRDMTDGIREATASFGELFGTAGEGFANLTNVMADYFDGHAEKQQQLSDMVIQYGDVQNMTADQQQTYHRIEGDMQRERINMYGNMIHAAKGFFKEGSTGWRVMEAAERAYRLFQFAMQVRAILMDRAHTASSVTNSGLRAAADGVAAVAKAIASLPFPLNIIAGAATIAFLVGIGVKLFGKGGGGGGGGASASASASKSSDKLVDTYSGPLDEYGAATSSYSVLKRGGTTVANDPRAAPGQVYGGNAQSGTNVSVGDTHLTIQGNTDDTTVKQVQQLLDSNRQATVQEARNLAAQDVAARSTRQSIGGGS